MNRGKIILMFLILPFIVVSVKAQSVKSENVVPDKRIAEAFGAEFVTEIMSDNQGLVLYYNYYLDNAYTIDELPIDKTDFLDSLVSLDISPTQDNKAINLLLLDLDLNFEKRTYYRMQKSQYVMVFYSGEELNDSFNKYKSSFSIDNNNQSK